MEEIDEAMKIAGQNFEQLSIAVKVSLLYDPKCMLYPKLRHVPF